VSRALHGGDDGNPGKPTAEGFYQQLLVRGKAKLAALIAVARKLLSILNAIIRDKKPWTPIQSMT